MLQISLKDRTQIIQMPKTELQFRLMSPAGLLSNQKPLLEK